MIKLFEKLFNIETMLYLVFGVMTTIVNFGSFLIFSWILGKKFYLVSNVFSFIIATLFAFITNKQFVFKSIEWKLKILIKELFSFVVARIGTFLIIEEAGLWMMVEIFKVNEYQIFILNGIFIAKIFLAFVAVLVNYILSKYLIFKK